jgi:hypothetical protein
MTKKTASPASAAAGQAAYHDGPPEIEFAGRRWLRGRAQPLTDAEFAALQARPDAAQFGFTFTGDPLAIPAPVSEE